MAGDWIKMQGNLWTNPKVVRIMSATKADKCRVIGALFRVWCLFDEHTEDGVLEGYTKFLLDDELRINGFSDAMESVDWLIDNNGESLQVPDFDDHMSKSAKKRAQDTKRKRESRKVSATETDKNTTREEKRRIKKSKQKKFTPPTVEQVAEYCSERGNSVDAEKFINHYQASDWMRGKNKIKDWKACVRTWEGSEKNKKIKSMSDSELLAMCEKLNIHTQGLNRFQIIQNLELAQ